MESFSERDVYLLASAVQRSPLFWSKLYCFSNGMTCLIQNALYFLKNLFYFVKGASNIDAFFHISYMHLIDSVCDIILLTNEVLLLGKFLLSLQDQNQTFSGIKFTYSWCFNEQKWKSYKPFVLKWHWKPKIGEYFYFLEIVLIILCSILLWCIWY